MDKTQHKAASPSHRFTLLIPIGSHSLADGGWHRLPLDTRGVTLRPSLWSLPRRHWAVLQFFSFRFAHRSEGFHHLPIPSDDGVIFYQNTKIRSILGQFRTHSIPRENEAFANHNEKGEETYIFLHGIYAILYGVSRPIASSKTQSHKLTSAHPAEPV
jgi:hypothetical protein